MTEMDPDERARQFAAESLAADDPTGWFDRLYSAAAAGAAVVLWDRAEPHPLLVQWAQRNAISGAGRRALTIGFGLGYDAEFLSQLGFDTVAFDVSDTAVQAAVQRFPDSVVRYVAANLLDPPEGWRNSFDLVVEIFTVQSMPEAVHATAIVHVGQMVNSGGTLLAIAGGREPGEPADGPPWPLTRAEVDSFGAGGLAPIRIEDLRDQSRPGARRWRAEFHRDG